MLVLLCSANCNRRGEVCMTHAEVYATNFCRVYHADDPVHPCQYSCLWRKVVDRVENLIHPQL